MNDNRKVNPIAAPYLVIQLKQAFQVARDENAARAKSHPMGPFGMYEIFEQQAATSLGLIESEGWKDYDVILFPAALLEFGTALTPSGQGLKSFKQYYQEGRITHIPASQAHHLFPK